MSVKTGSSGFPKHQLLSSLRERGDTAFFQTQHVSQLSGGRAVTRPIFAGGHMDKAPLLLCASTGTSLPGEPKVRRRTVFRNGRMHTTTYRLDQPDMHATYRSKYNAVDRFNSMSGQPGTLPDKWKTKSCKHRLFATTISWIDTNAQTAWNYYNPLDKLTKADWYMQLSEACAANPFAPPVIREIFELSGHDGPFKSTCRKCWVCGTRTLWRCECGRPICRSQTRVGRDGQRPQPRLCFKEHLARVSHGDEDHTGSPRVRRGRPPQG